MRNTSWNIFSWLVWKDNTDYIWKRVGLTHICLMDPELRVRLTKKAKGWSRSRALAEAVKERRGVTTEPRAWACEPSQAGNSRASVLLEPHWEGMVLWGKSVLALPFGTHGYLVVSQWLLTGLSKEDRSNHIKIFLYNWRLNDILSWVWSDVAHCVGVQTDIIHVLFCLWEKP